jgi:hypothetical protein
VLAVQRAVGAAVTALVGIVRMLDLNHIGAEDGKLIGRKRAGQHMGDVDDANTLERSGHAELLRRGQVSAESLADAEPRVAARNKPEIAVMRGRDWDQGAAGRELERGVAEPLQKGKGIV